MLNAIVEAPDAALSRQRAGRYAARHLLWDETTLKRVRHCGRTVQANAGGITVKVSTDKDGKRSAGYGGVQTCGSVWACPVCSAKIAEGRRDEIARALTAWVLASGHPAPHGIGPVMPGKIALATFTMSHRAGQSLRSLWDALTYAWSKMTSGRGWATDKRIAGDVQWIRVVEVTEGDNGWHVHVHAILLLDPMATDATAQYLEGAMYGRWVNALGRRGLSASRAHGADVKLLRGDPAAALGEYFTKAVYAASFEVARGDLKDARFGNRTPFAILAAVVANGDAEDLDAWHEWERASSGRRQIGWSQGTRALLLAGEIEKTDQELSDEAKDGETEAQIDGPLWAAIVQARADYLVLMAFEHSRQAGTGMLLSFAGRAADLEAAREAKARDFGTRRRPVRRGR